ncbi:MAG TPA: hypothetical protein P5511_07275, partial [Candidatus Goldiibacteriota bacterium]|nr:hypothetical protein [Candidatus Goldiibacteriota bacterium]
MSRIITLINRKEGCGKTTAGLCLCAALAESGTSAYVEVSYGLHDIELVLEKPENHFFSKDGRDRYYSEKHGFNVMMCGYGDIGGVIETAEGRFDNIVVDTKGMPEEELLQVSDALLVILDAGAPGMRAGTDTIKRLQEMKFPASIIRAVVNRNVNTLLSESDLAGIFSPIKLAAVLPEERAVHESCIKGLVFGNGGKKSAFSAGIRKIAEEIRAMPELKRRYEKRQSILKAALPDTAGLKPALSAAGSGEGLNLLKKKVHAALIEEMEIQKLEKDALTHPEKKHKIHGEILSRIRGVLDRVENSLNERDAREAFIQEVFNEAVGLGAIEGLLADREVTEIMVNGPSRIYYEKAGKIYVSR